MVGLWDLRRLGRWNLLHGMVSRIAGMYYARGKIRRIPFGPLAGQRFYCAEGVQFWMPLGLYEKETSKWLAGHLEEGDCFYDVGANVGYFSLLGSSLVGQQGLVVAVEPVAASIQSIRQQVSINSLKNVQVLRCAASDENGRGVVVVERNPANSHLESEPIRHAAADPQRAEEVGIVTLDHLCSTVGRIPDLIKIDVEGVEVRVLRGARNVIGNRRPALLVSTHSEESRLACTRLLEDGGYRVSPLEGFEHELVANAV